MTQTHRHHRDPLLKRITYDDVDLTSKKGNIL